MFGSGLLPCKGLLEVAVLGRDQDVAVGMPGLRYAEVC